MTILAHLCNEDAWAAPAGLLKPRDSLLHGRQLGLRTGKRGRRASFRQPMRQAAHCVCWRQSSLYGCYGVAAPLCGSTVWRASWVGKQGAVQ